MNLTATSIGDAWALVRRNGDTPGKRISTRMAYLVTRSWVGMVTQWPIGATSCATT
jgi:hypothetical protein